jgi:hypothetical protein
MSRRVEDSYPVNQLRTIVEAGVDDWDALGDHHKTLTEAVRKADQDHEHSGGGSRHWVRECFWPRLRDCGLILVPSLHVIALIERVQHLEAELEKLKKGEAQELSCPSVCEAEST